MIEETGTYVLDNDLICPRCGEIIEEVNTYCPHCINMMEMERARHRLIREDLKLSRLKSICRALLTCWRMILLLFFLTLGLKLFIHYTDLPPSLNKIITIVLFLSSTLAIGVISIHYILARKLYRNSLAKLQQLGDFYI